MSIRPLPLLTSLLFCALAGCEPQPAQPPITEPAIPAAAATGQHAGNVISRPTWDITTEEAFDASTIPAYAGDHAAVYAHIDANREAHLAELQRWLRQPSVSAENFGVREMAEMVRADFEALGFQEAELVETDGHPGVWGYYDTGADTTLMVYMMYDVQPVNPKDWQSPPFEAQVVAHELGKVLMARGATNQKGPERAFLNALQSIIAVDGKLPVNLMITAEGEEELGSPHYPQIIDAYEERLKTADGAIFPRTGQARDGRTTMTLGNKGIVYFEAESRGGDWGGPGQAEIHGSFKAITDSPVWRLLQGLSSLTSEDGNTVLVPGFYDDVRPPTLEEQRLINGYAKEWNDELMQQSYAVSHWIEGKTGRDALLDLIYSPTLNIDGIWAGYTGEGVKTILPHKATAKLDARLPMGMHPETTLARIREHLAAQGFADIELTQLAGYPASQTSVDTALARAVISVLAKYGSPPTVNPRTAGSAPFYLFTQRLGLPMVPMGLGYGTGAHAPNEILLVEPAEGVPIAGLADIEKSYADLLYALAAEKDHSEP